MTETLKSGLLAEWVSGYAATLAAFEKLVAGLSDAQANFKPAPKKWSIVECIEHLNLGFECYLPVMATEIENARSAGKTGSEPYAKGPFTGRIVVSYLRKGADKRRAPAPSMVKPAKSGLKTDSVATNFRAHMQRLIDLAEKSDGLSLGKIRFTSPESRLVRVSLAQAFELHALHTPRHIEQASRVKTAKGYPA